MKSYSFIRENAYKVVHPWNKDDKSGILMSLGYGLQLKSCEFSSWQSPRSCPSVTLHQLVQPVEVSRLLRNTTQLMSCTGNFHTYSVIAIMLFIDGFNFLAIILGIMFQLLAIMLQLFASILAIMLQHPCYLCTVLLYYGQRYASHSPRQAVRLCQVHKANSLMTAINTKL